MAIANALQISVVHQVTVSNNLTFSAHGKTQFQNILFNYLVLKESYLSVYKAEDTTLLNLVADIKGGISH